jgi:hypothetical protein
MFAVAALASTVPDALHGGQNAFVLAYVSVRLILLVLYVRVYRHVEVARPVAGWFIFMFGLAVCDWWLYFDFLDGVVFEFPRHERHAATAGGPF